MTSDGCDTADRLVTTPWGEHVRCLVTGALTHGAYDVAEIDAPPCWRRATYVHHLADETFYVVVGDVTAVVDAAAPVLLTPGSALHVQRGAARALARTGPGKGRVLLVQTPGGLLDQPLTPLSAPTSGIELVDPPGLA